MRNVGITHCNAIYTIRKTFVRDSITFIADFFPLQVTASMYANMASQRTAPNNHTLTCDGCSVRRAIVLCHDCRDMYCAACHLDHDSVERLAGHKSENIDKLNLCSVHPKYIMTEFCETCNQIICLQCVIKAHKAHSTVDLTAAVNDTRDKLLDLETKYKAATDDFAEYEVNINSLTMLMEQKEDVVRNSVNQAADLIMSLTNKFKLLSETFFMKTAKPKQYLQKQQANIDSEKADMENVQNFLKPSLEKDLISARSFLQCHSPFNPDSVSESVSIPDEPPFHTLVDRLQELHDILDNEEFARFYLTDVPPSSPNSESGNSSDEVETQHNDNDRTATKRTSDTPDRNSVCGEVDSPDVCQSPAKKSNVETGGDGESSTVVVIPSTSSRNSHVDTVSPRNLAVAPGAARPFTVGNAPLWHMQGHPIRLPHGQNFTTVRRTLSLPRIPAVVVNQARPIAWRHNLPPHRHIPRGSVHRSVNMVTAAGATGDSVQMIPCHSTLTGQTVRVKPGAVSAARPAANTALAMAHHQARLLHSAQQQMSSVTRPPGAHVLGWRPANVPGQRLILPISHAPGRAMPRQAPATVNLAAGLARNRNVAGAPLTIPAGHRLVQNNATHSPR